MNGVDSRCRMGRHKGKQMTDFANDLVEMMNAWDWVMEESKSRFPNASREELFSIASSVMNHALHLNQPAINQVTKNVTM